MKTIFFLSCLALLSGPTLLSGQTVEGNRHSLGIHAGLSPYWVYDQAASPLLYFHQLYQLGLSYRAETPNQLWDLRLQGGFGPSHALGVGEREVRFMERDAYGVTDTFNVPVRGQAIQGELALGWAYRIRPHLAVGVLLADDLYYPQGFVTPGLANMAWLAPRVQWDLPIGKTSRLDVTASTPIVAFVSRLPYHGSVSQPEKSALAGFFSQNTTLNTLNRFQRLDLSVGYQFQVSRKLTLGAEWSLIALQHTRMLDLRMIRHAFGIQLILKPTK
ncbi:MAG: hypothetical protein H6563_02455 [Lewinellaceae bacterium]|nr:hypothetical protein [Lewinellaceae bacterium]